VEGDAYDASGNLGHVRVDESALLNFIVDTPTPVFGNTGEVLAAGRSLSQGDSLPLLRLGAEGGISSLDFANFGPPTEWSIGAMFATTCADVSMPFDWKVSVPERIDEYTAVAEGLPPFYFGPFSATVATGDLFTFLFPWPCQYWQQPTKPSPIAELNAHYPSVPTLVFTGDMDSRVPHDEVVKVAALFPQSTVISAETVGHQTIYGIYADCASALMSEFIETTQVPDTSCLSTTATAWSAVGRFPRLARDARPAAVDPSGHNGIGPAELRVVTVAVATATDAEQRLLLSGGVGVGLRGGSFSADLSNLPTVITTLTNCAFATDVIVNGTVTWVPLGSFVADLTVNGSGTAGGTLHIEGMWQAPGPVGHFKVSGTLGGKHVAALVPEA